MKKNIKITGNTMMYFIVVITVSLFVAIISGSAFHELGHGLMAVTLGGDFSALCIWPGIQVYPEISFDDMHIFILGYADIKNVEINWKIGLVNLMGSLTTAIISYCLVGLAAFCRSKSIALSLLVISIIYAWDIILYSILPMIGLKHGLFIGGDIAEPFLGAQKIGVPNWFYFMCLALHILIYNYCLCSIWKKKVMLIKAKGLC